MKIVKIFFVCAQLFALSAFAGNEHIDPIKFCHYEEEYYLRALKRESTASSGSPKLGDMTVIAYAASHQPDGPQIGLIISRQINLGLNGVTPGPNSMRDALITSFLPGGTVVTTQVTDYDSEKVTDLTRAISGGAGKYFGATGTVRSVQTKGGDHPAWKSYFKMLLPCQ